MARPSRSRDAEHDAGKREQPARPAPNHKSRHSAIKADCEEHYRNGLSGVLHCRLQRERYFVAGVFCPTTTDLGQRSRARRSKKRDDRGSIVENQTTPSSLPDSKKDSSRSRPTSSLPLLARKVPLRNSSGFRLCMGFLVKVVASLTADRLVPEFPGEGGVVRRIPLN
jgi:hypothetical protein